MYNCRPGMSQQGVKVFILFKQSLMGNICVIMDALYRHFTFPFLEKLYDGKHNF
jgi:hypothetical protein